MPTWVDIVWDQPGQFLESDNTRLGLLKKMAPYDLGRHLLAKGIVSRRPFIPAIGI